MKNDFCYLEAKATSSGGQGGDGGSGGSGGDGIGPNGQEWCSESIMMFMLTLQQ